MLNIGFGFVCKFEVVRVVFFSALGFVIPDVEIVVVVIVVFLLVRIRFGLREFRQLFEDVVLF